MTQSRFRSLGLLLAILLALTAVIAPGASLAAQDATPGAATPIAGASPVASEGRGVDLDVLFIGAHPDDESGRLSTFGQWNELQGLEVGVITITRGEGGGNAVGKEEGPALGLLREREERAAVGMAGIEHVYNLDKVDFYYTVSAPLTEETWGYDDTLARVVRVVRETRPEIIVTMNPAPTPGNHGHHQMAARFAVAAYAAAGDPEVFQEQIADEGLEPFAPSRIFTSAYIPDAPTGESCASAVTAPEPTDVIFGVWSGTASEQHDGKTWAQIEREAQRNYASQGWSGFGDAPTDPDEIGCDYFLLIDSRAPYTVDNDDPTAMLEGATQPTSSGLPAGTLFDVETTQFDVVAGQPFDVEVTAASGDEQASDIAASYELPEGWTSNVTSTSVENGHLTETVSITPSEDAEPATRYRIGATLTIDGATGQNVEIVQVAPPVEGHLEPLPQVAQFREWVETVDQPVLDSLIKPVTSMGVGETKDVVVNVTNNTGEEQDASVTLVLAEGFTADSDSQGVTLGPNESTSVTFAVTNDDASLPTANQGGIDGDYLLDIRTVGNGVATTEVAGLDLVPAVTVSKAGSTPAGATPAADAAATPVAGGPQLDGTITDGEYTSAPLDLSRVWEGDDPDSPADASGTAWLTWDDDGIYVAVAVTDDTLGTVLPQDDAKRHWRTDSVEIAIDPLGTAENTSATFKVGVFPTTEEGGPAAYRDADAFQGPVAETAPGFEVASTVSEPYSGYVLETFIPYDALPAPVDPDNMAMNIFIYDSDTQDLTGQTRLGWSTYGGVQGDPYRWGHVTLDGYTISDGGELQPPRMPLDAAQSVDSPQSILQSASDGVPLGGGAAVAEGSQVTVADGPAVTDGTLTATLQAGDSDGTVHAFAIGPDGVLGDQEVPIDAGGTADIAIPIGDADPASVTLAYSFQTDDGAVDAVAEAVQP
jgi:LmbE family N-acetylglucosaminyl deacetylase